MKKSNTLIKYIIEGSIVFLSVFLSFYITDVNREKNMKERKNILLKDLSNSMIQDTLQIYSYIAEKEIILETKDGQGTIPLEEIYDVQVRKFAFLKTLGFSIVSPFLLVLLLYGMSGS